MAIADFRKGFDRIRIYFAGDYIRKRRFPQLISTIQCLYDGTRIAVKNNYIISQLISVSQVVKQGCSMSLTFKHLYWQSCGEMKTSSKPWFCLLYTSRCV